MWITFKYKAIGNEQPVIKKINLDYIECININLFPDRIDVITPMRFESDTGVYSIYKEVNENFEEIKQKLMEL